MHFPAKKLSEKGRGEVSLSINAAKNRWWVNFFLSAVVKMFSVVIVVYGRRPLSLKLIHSLFSFLESNRPLLLINEKN